MHRALGAASDVPWRQHLATISSPSRVGMCLEVRGPGSMTFRLEKNEGPGSPQISQICS